jgi:hypothetical protein
MVGLPDVAWISARDGSRAPGDLEDQAAGYHPGRHELTINADFRAISDLIAHWAHLRIDHRVGAGDAAVAGLPNGLSPRAGGNSRRDLDRGLPMTPGPRFGGNSPSRTSARPCESANDVAVKA